MRDSSRPAENALAEDMKRADAQATLLQGIAENGGRLSQLSAEQTARTIRRLLAALLAVREHNETSEPVQFVEPELGTEDES